MTELPKYSRLEIERRWLVDFSDELAASQFEPPPFVRREITNEPAFSGVSLAEFRSPA